MGEGRVLPLPVNWERSDLMYVAIVNLLERGDCPAHHFNAHVMFDSKYVCWLAVVILDGLDIYRSEHRERDEAAGACVVAMQRALDVRYP